MNEKNRQSSTLFLYLDAGSLPVEEKRRNNCQEEGKTHFLIAMLTDRSFEQRRQRHIRNTIFLRLGDLENLPEKAGT
jgi:hypothetical protein